LPIRRSATRRIAARGRQHPSITKENEMDIETNTALETKAGIPPDAVVTHAEMMRAFEEFKEANDKRLAGIERRRVDVLLNEKLARIDQTIDAQARRLDEIKLKNSRPIIAGERLRGSPEHKMAFEAYVRSGEDTNLRTREWNWTRAVCWRVNTSPRP
jgi:predicted phage gp36 major capsid-like protein